MVSSVEPSLQQLRFKISHFIYPGSHFSKYLQWFKFIGLHNHLDLSASPPVTTSNALPISTSLQRQTAIRATQRIFSSAPYTVRSFSRMCASTWFRTHPCHSVKRFLLICHIAGRRVRNERPPPLPEWINCNAVKYRARRKNAPSLSRIV